MEFLGDTVAPIARLRTSNRKFSEIATPADSMEFRLHCIDTQRSAIVPPCYETYPLRIG